MVSEKSDEFKFQHRKSHPAKQDGTRQGTHNIKLVYQIKLIDSRNN